MVQNLRTIPIEKPFDLYESVLDELDFPGHPTGEQFAELYETVTSRYDEYRDGCDGLEQVRTWIEQDAPSLPEILAVGLADQQLDIRALVWLCQDQGYDWDDIRSTLAGRADSFLYATLLEPDDWYRLQAFLKENGWVVKYRALRAHVRAPYTRFHGRSVGALASRFGALVVGDDGAPGAVYRNQNQRYQRVPA